MLKHMHKRRGGFTLVEIMIVVAIIALLAAIAVPGFLRSRKRSQATTIKNDLRLIDAAVDQYAIENNLTKNSTVAWAAIQSYLKTGSTLYNTGKSVIGGDYTTTVYKVDMTGIPTPTGTGAALGDVTDATFWSPYSLVN